MKTAAEKAEEILINKLIAGSLKQGNALTEEEAREYFQKIRDQEGDGVITSCIEAMQEFSNLQLQERWISVKDRLPEEDAIVLVAFQWHENPLTTMEAFYTKEDQFKRKDMFIINSAFFPVDNITHWQPLPSPPKLQSPTG